MKPRAPRRPVLDADVDERLLEALAPVEPEAARARTLWTRIQAQIAGEAQAGFVTVHRGDGEWLPIGPRVAVKHLVERPGMHAFLLRMERGATFPAHDHPTAEECVVLEGEVWLGDVHARAGDFHLAPAGRRHGTLRTEEGCLLYLRTGGRAGVSLL